MSMGNNKNRLTVVMYHYVRDLKNSRYPAIKGCDVRDFREQVLFIKKNYTPVTVEQIIDSYNGVEKLPDHAILLTFDDAYTDHFTYAFPVLYHEHIQGVFFPSVKAVTEHTVLDVNKVHFILANTPVEKMSRLLDELRRMVNANKEEYGLDSYDTYFEKLAVANRFDPKEVIFVKRLLQVALPEDLRRNMTTELFEKSVGMDESMFSRELYMTIDQIKCMVDCGMHIGSHGYDHYWLSSLSKEKQEFEIAKSIEFIKIVGGDVNNWTIGYPYGDYNEDTISLLKKHGCKMGFTTRVAVADLDEDDEDALYKIPRLDVNDLPKTADAPVNKWYY